MRISAIRVYSLDLSLVGAGYTFAKGKKLTTFDTTVVILYECIHTCGDLVRGHNEGATTRAPEAPGLGLHPRAEKLGDPVAVYQ